MTAPAPFTDRRAVLTHHQLEGGAINTITPRKTVSKNATGMVSGGFLLDVERVNLDELQRQYPEAFKQPYNRGSGLTLERMFTQE
jgi:hypothetical protein